MTRLLHRWPGVLAAALLLVLGISGAALSLFPAGERLATPQPDPALSVATLAARVEAAVPAVEQIRRLPSGRIVAWWFEGGTPRAAVIDPATGEPAGTVGPAPAERWLTVLHRSLFLGDGGRIAVAGGALAMLVLCLSGAAMVARRAGGWRRWFAPLRGPLAGRVHVEIARIAVLGLLVSSLSGLWMSASTFGLLPDGGAPFALPAETSGETGAPLAAMETLATTPVGEFRSLGFPEPGDPGDMFTLKTDRGTFYLDQGTGALLAADPLTFWQRVSETVYMLHTGRGAAAFGLLLGIAALAVPVLAITGLVLWLAAWRARPRLRGNVPAGRAGTVVLVGSEGGSTWGFAATLHAALTAAGEAVHVAPMSAFDPARYRAARHLLILAATYGDGAAPASAKGFLDRLAAAPVLESASLAVLGFGDRSFPAWCAYAATVAERAAARGWKMLLPFDTVDRQSPQDFARWGRALAAATGLGFELNHQPVRPASLPLTLLSRRDYGVEVQAPTAILRFALPAVPLRRRLAGRGFGRFQAGDLLGILPEGSALPRFYSLASGTRDGFVEIVVRRQPGGLCSGQLLDLAPGGTVNAFLRRNPGFHAGRGRAPLILIGAGTGVGPLAGFVRANRRRRPVHLFFGMRHPDSDFLYGEELAAWERDGRLTRLSLARSRGERPHYVQDALRTEAAAVRELVRRGARIMVCGGREMAGGVAEALAAILAPTGLTPALLRMEGRYVEDVY